MWALFGSVSSLNLAQKILDVPCGNGRLTLPLAAEGYTLTGVDISADFLTEGRATAEKQQLKTSWEQREMRNLPWKEEFDGAYCFGNSFGYLDDVGNVEFLRTVFRTFRPGARFVLDASSVAENVLPILEKHTEMQFGDILFIEDNVYDETTHRLDTDYTFVRGEVKEKKLGSQRIYTLAEFRHLLTGAGFVVLTSTDQPRWSRTNRVHRDSIRLQ
jgi:SAM-dependent methyltransferase